MRGMDSMMGAGHRQQNWVEHADRGWGQTDRVDKRRAEPEREGRSRKMVPPQEVVLIGIFIK